MDAAHGRTEDRTARVGRQPIALSRLGRPVALLALIATACFLLPEGLLPTGYKRGTGGKKPSAFCTTGRCADDRIIGDSLRRCGKFWANSTTSPLHERSNVFDIRLSAQSHQSDCTPSDLQRGERSPDSTGRPALATDSVSPKRRPAKTGVAFAAATELLPGEAGPTLPEQAVLPEEMTLPKEPDDAESGPAQRWQFKQPGAVAQVPAPQEVLVAPADETSPPPLGGRTQMRFVPLRPLPDQQARPLVPEPGVAAPPSTSEQAEPSDAERSESTGVPEDRHTGPAVERQPPASAAGRTSEPSDSDLPSSALPQPEASPLEPSVHWEDRSEQLEQIARQADRHTRHGFELADRGALFAARAEFITALRLVAQGLDAEYRTSNHSRALAAGLAAVEEAGDFVPDNSRLEAHLDLPSLIGSHVTPVLKNANKAELAPMLCVQCYLSFAQEQLAAAAGREIAGSMALCALGKVYGTLAMQRNPAARAAEAKAVTFYQSALLVYPGNFMAANELGVLYARHGNYAAARAALEHSVRIHQHAAGWRNLAVVYRQLGHADLAAQAARQAENISRRQLVKQSSQLPSGTVVQWIDPVTFAQTARDVPPATPPPEIPAHATPARATPARATAARATAAGRTAAGATAVPASASSASAPSATAASASAAFATPPGGPRAQAPPPASAAKTSKPALPALPAPLSGLLGPSVARRNEQNTVNSAPSRQ